MALLTRFCLFRGMAADPFPPKWVGGDWAGPPSPLPPGDSRSGVTPCPGDTASW